MVPELLINRELCYAYPTRWTILNVKTPGMDKRKRQPLQAVISDPNDMKLDYIVQFGEMCLQMSGKQGK